MDDARQVLSGPVTVSNPRQTRRKWGAVGLMAIALGAPAAIGGGLSLLLLPAIAMLVAAVAGAASAERDPGWAEAVLSGQLVFDRDAVHVEDPGGLVLGDYARDDVVDGWIEYVDNQGHNLVLVMNGGDEIRLQLETPIAASETLLAQLGLDERAVRMALVADPRGVRGCMGAFMGLMLVFGVVALVVALGGMAAGRPELASMLMTALVFLFPVVAMPHFLVPNRVLIGRDGVLVERLFRRRRFYSYERLQEVSHDPAMLWLTDDRGSLGVRASDGASATAARVLRERHARYREQEATDIHAILDRGERSLDDYRAMLEKLLEPGQASFRRLVVHADDLVRVVADPKATPTQRAGAAYALAAKPEAASSERLRVAIDAVAQPALRVALEHASEGELEAELLAEAEQAVAHARGD